MSFILAFTDIGFLLLVEEVNRNLSRTLPPDVLPFSDWHIVATRWEKQLQSLVPETRVLARGTFWKIGAPAGVQMNSNGKRPRPSTPEVNSSELASSLVEGESSTPESVPKGPALEKVILSTDATKLTERMQQMENARGAEKRRVDKLESRLHAVVKSATRTAETAKHHANMINRFDEDTQETRQNLDQFTESQDTENEGLKQDIEDVDRKLENQTEDTTTQLQSMQVHIKAMQDQIKKLQHTIKMMR